jgi:hypothetical protein
MMVAVFAAMTLALALDRRGSRDWAMVSLVAALGLALALFLFEIYSPEYGFRMPWIQTELATPEPQEFA